MRRNGLIAAKVHPLSIATTSPRHLFHKHWIHTTKILNMSTSAPNGSSSSPADGPRKLKILMLHGTSPSSPLPPLSITDSCYRLHPIRHPLPRQNPRPRKSPPKSLPLHWPHHQPIQTSHQASARLSTLLPRRHPTHLSHRTPQAPPRRHPRLHALRSRIPHFLRERLRSRKYTR
jgi:hypothetical protein